ncbi:UDP-2,3-diacylglucosamine hydrolase [Campylobacter blaseri]|uniref:UDP-2,3-diacylglucosamine hydrolase n=1 Tax=Campylobacter blaseri TaxID=2042961 RepID=A0A2P8R153_9BACT|nr:UDP-2,3-diacylglucosamine diphosphatase [Campylobacter blaseri]PSM52225.1 UDP-2,3-diacylglucosamine hydrolase [Campylobacter blaseri]PSM53991.1 UDP-2,3-diacylglucosamine hydrolase [Campylobacter blaseri]QKF85428.1 UDP-2,3-diacylglucosamine hydrolase [Campylobacter blaseri]
MHNSYEIKEGAIFISDAHENSNKDHFYKFLKDVKNDRYEFSQIFLMGDIFDFLSFTEYSKKFYQKEIDLLNELSRTNEIYYFEGNHDYNISGVFPNIKVFDIQNQPVRFKTKIGKDVSMAHGDIFLPPITKYILLFLRNRTFLKFMNFLDKITNFKITKSILKHQKDKELYKEMNNFEEFAKYRLSKHKAEYVIEGHYHQDKVVEFNDMIYFNLNSYAVTDKIYQAKFKKNRLFLENIKD